MPGETVMVPVKGARTGLPEGASGGAMEPLVDVPNSREIGTVLQRMGYAGVAGVGANVAGRLVNKYAPNADPVLGQLGVALAVGAFMPSKQGELMSTIITLNAAAAWSGRMGYGGYID